MKINLKLRVLSLLLAVSLMCGALFSIPAYALTECGCGGSPTVYVAGVASLEIYSDVGTEDEALLFPPSADAIVGAVKELVVPLVYSAVTDDWDVFCDEAFPVLIDLLGDVGCNTDGSPKDGVGVKWSFSEVDSHAPNESFSFLYDWRLDPMDVARELAECIDRVVERTGHSKIKLKAFSMGTAIAMAYLSQYGFDKVETIVFDSGALNGVSVAGMPLAGNISIDSPEAVLRFAENFLNDSDQSNAIRAAFALLRRIGVLGYVTDFLDHIIDEIKDRLYSEVMPYTFAYMPGLWCLVDDANYEQAKEFLLDADADRLFIERIDDYHYNVQKNVKTILDDGLAEGVKLYFLSKYNMQLTPVLDEPDLCGDAVIDTKYSSCFATVANLRQTLGDGYVQAVDDGHSHLSADGMIDASTCMYPEYTWFVKNAIHFYPPDPYDDFIDKLLASDTQLDVRSDPLYPQFMFLEESEEVMRPLLADDVETPRRETYLSATLKLILALVKLV